MCTQETIQFSIYDNAHWATCCAISRCCFLVATDYALPKALKYGILPQWKPNLKS